MGRNQVRGNCNMWVRIVPQETAGQETEDLLVPGWSMYISALIIIADS